MQYDDEDICLGFNPRNEPAQRKEYNLFLDRLALELEKGTKYHEEVYKDQEYERYDVSMIIRKGEKPMVFEQLVDYLVPDECVLSHETTRFVPNQRFRKIISDHLEKSS